MGTSDEAGEHVPSGAGVRAFEDHSLGIPMDKVLDVLAKFLPAAASAAGPAVAPPPAGAA